MQGVELFKELLIEYFDRPWVLYGDPDVDGLISLKLMTEFAEMLGKQYSYYVNEHRKHGFILNPTSLRGSLVIASDFSITEKELQVIVDNDVAVLSTDHHKCQSEFISVEGKAKGIVINNQYPFEPEEDRYLSGAGVFYELICSVYPDFKSKVREALVGVTLLSDVRAIENSKAREYLRKTYSISTEEPYINYLISSTLDSDFGFGVPKLDRNFIDFTLSPTINALLRYNKTTEAVDFILGNGLRTGSKYRTSQRDLIATMTERSLVLAFPSVVILAINDTYFLDIPDIELSDFIGALCSNYKDSHGGISTLGFTISNGVVTRASFRGRYDDIHYLEGFRHIGLDANGHGNAFGILDFEPTQETWTQINDLVVELEAYHEVTYTVIDVPNLSIAMLQNGMKHATENCYVRDWYRTYWKYTGVCAKVVKETYKTVELTPDDLRLGTKPDVVKKGVGYKYILDSDGKKVPKYIEYMVDGRTVKSFGVDIKDGVILPMLERGYIQLYVKSILD